MLTSHSSTTVHQDTRERILLTGESLILGKGFSALGLSEILGAAAVPKGSFYHYFQSKEGFGVAMLERYFVDYQLRLRRELQQDGRPACERLLAYFNGWLESTRASSCNKLCLAVKLAAEVSDLSEPMRQALTVGMQSITAVIADVIREAQTEGQLQGQSQTQDALELAEFIYATWVGASLLSKVHLEIRPLELAMQQTKVLLHA
jgi:TetR/AcrR family transcriptional repressor of nem operon